MPKILLAPIAGLVAFNMFGTDDYFPFFIADITEIRFPDGQP